MALARVTDDEYMLHSHVIVEQKDDCFYKMDQMCESLNKQDAKKGTKKAAKNILRRSVTDLDSDYQGSDEYEEVGATKMCVLHSRYASKRGTMRDQQAHPVFDSEERVAVFHNGFVTNYKELFTELFPNKDPSKMNLTDSELIAMMIGKQLDGGADL